MLRTAARYTRHDIRQYLDEHARVPVRELGWGLTSGHSEAFTVHDYVELGGYAPEYLIEPETLVRVLSTPDVVYVGDCDDPDRNRIMTLWSGCVQPVTKPIELPAHWEALV